MTFFTPEILIKLTHKACLFEEQYNKNYLKLKYLIFDDLSLNLDIFYLVNMLLAWLTILN